MFCALPNIETQYEAHILQGFERFEALKHGVNHVFCEVLTTSKAFKHAQNLNLVSPPKMAPGYYSLHMKSTIFWASWGWVQEALQGAK